jgi:hypothetical protein
MITIRRWVDVEPCDIVINVSSGERYSVVAIGGNVIVLRSLATGVYKTITLQGNDATVPVETPTESEALGNLSKQFQMMLMHD